MCFASHHPQVLGAKRPKHVSNPEFLGKKTQPSIFHLWLISQGWSRTGRWWSSTSQGQTGSARTGSSTWRTCSAAPNSSRRSRLGTSAFAIYKFGLLPLSLACYPCLWPATPVFGVVNTVWCIRTSVALLIYSFWSPCMRRYSLQNSSETAALARGLKAPCSLERLDLTSSKFAPKVSVRCICMTWYPFPVFEGVNNVLYIWRRPILM